MSANHYCEAEDLLEPAYEALENLNDEYDLKEDLPSNWNREQPESGPYSTTTAFVEDGIGRNIEASVESGTCELTVAYNAWKDYNIEGREDDRIRFWTREEIATFDTETDAISDAVEKAYEESLDITEDDLDRNVLLDAQDI